ncbi:MAG: hypothetical protein Q7K39_02265 [Candidatus Magasanikbacteria bacterium]|nr:hypothetical protein [Candidatus Magasanikbacteria bacterium]
MFTTFPLTITKSHASAKISVAIDRHGFERLADSLGLFRTEFLNSLDHAEADIANGKTKKLRSLKDLRNKK